MVRLLADENFDGRIVSGLRGRRPGLDLVTVQEAGIMGALDPRILAWAAARDRILLTHDQRTIPGFVYDRVSKGEPMPGAIVVPDLMPIGPAIEDLLVVLLASSPEELRDRVVRLPL